MEKKIPTYPNIDDYARPWGFDDLTYQLDLEVYTDWKEEQKAKNALLAYTSNRKKVKPKDFIIETEWNMGFWSLIPQINWNKKFYEIELRWLCAAIMFRNNKKFIQSRNEKEKTNK